MTNEMQQIDAYMANLRWTRDVNYGGELSYVRPDFDYCVKLEDDYWELCEFTDSDREGNEGEPSMAVGRYQSFEDGETLAELTVALREYDPAVAAEHEISVRADAIDAAYERWRDHANR